MMRLKSKVITTVIGLLITLGATADSLPSHSNLAMITGHIVNNGNTDVSAIANPYLPSIIHAQKDQYFAFDHYRIHSEVSMHYSNISGRGCIIKMQRREGSILINTTAIQGNEVCKVTASSILMNAD